METKAALGRLASFDASHDTKRSRWIRMGADKAEEAEVAPEGRWTSLQRKLHVPANQTPRGDKGQCYTGISSGRVCVCVCVWGGGGGWPLKILDCTITKPEKEEGEKEESEGRF